MKQWLTVHLPVFTMPVMMRRALDTRTRMRPRPRGRHDLRRREAVATETEAVVVVIALRTRPPPSHLAPSTGAQLPRVSARRNAARSGAVLVSPPPLQSTVGIHVRDVVPLGAVGRDVVVAGCLTAALQPCIGHASRVGHQIAVRLVERPATERLDDEPRRARSRCPSTFGPGQSTFRKAGHALPWPSGRAKAVMTLDWYWRTNTSIA